MFLDASAIVELITRGPRVDEMSRMIDGVSGLFYTGPTVEFEATAAIARIKRCSVAVAHDLVLEFVRELAAQRMTITPEIGDQAIAAFAAYGKGRHPARLNFGDCFSYAMAKAAAVPLLYIGNDFAKTDIG